MNKKHLITTGILGFLGACVTYWPIPYEKLEMLKMTFIMKWFIVAFVLGVIAISLLKLKIFESSLLISIGFVIAVICRIFFEISVDSSMHNLWPFEVFISILISFSSAIAGALITYAIIALLNKKSI